MEKIYSEFNNLKKNIRKLKKKNLNHIDIKRIVSNLLANLKFLRNSCVNAIDTQSYISQLPHFFNILLPILKNNLNDIMLNNSFQMNVDDSEKLCKMSWELIANTCVMNIIVQKIVWRYLGQLILDKLTNEITAVTDIQLMILYNMLLKCNLEIENSKLLELSLDIWEKSCDSSLPETIKLDFVHIILEHLIIKYPKLYESIVDTSIDRKYEISFLKYISCYIQSDCPIEPLHEILLNFITKEFIMTSDCVINPSPLENHNPKKVYILLEIISSASGQDNYKTFFDNQHSLFLNVGALLQQINEFGKISDKNEFTPMEKLEEVAINSEKLKNYDFEREISFEFKKMLVRTLANLSYKNKTNQQYAREARIIFAILNCTTMDARNPLIREWSILAIRNLCEDCPENQKTIKNLNKIGNVPNNILRDIKMDFSSLRINPK